MLARGDSSGLNNLALQLGGRRQFERAEELLRAAVLRSDATLQRLGNLRAVLRNQGKWTEADSVGAEMTARFPSNPSTRLSQINAASDLGDLEAWRRGVDSVARAPDQEAPAWALYQGAEIAFAEGRATEANRLLRAGWRVDSTVGRPAPAIAAAGTALQLRINFGLTPVAELRAFEAALAKTRLSDLPASDAPYFEVAQSFAQAGRPDRARETMALYRAAADTAQLRAQQPAQDNVMASIAVAEKRWADAVRLRRAADSLPDGPSGACVHCLSLALVDIFAEGGMADSALAQWEVYKRTPWGSRPRTGPDFSVRAVTIEAVGKMYEQRGDTARAVEAFRDFVERWKNADPELQPRVVEARKRLEALAPVERVRR
jgi:tetratricopeptide (TPR) repeat protein